MTIITLNPVAYYDINDIYCYQTDNRPLYNLSSNIDLLNTTQSYAGFYQEVSANPGTEPVGGFLPYTCAYVGANGYLYPIDITQSALVMDYSTVPIYLVIKALGSSQYSCLSFSASFNIPNINNLFLTGSIGHGLKVGPGGALADELYFDLYYSSYGYQNIYVGKILTPSTISFGGNQVNILSDNTFLSKNKNDSTTGLITRYLDNSTTTVANQNILLNSTFSPYPFVAYINQIGSAYNNTAISTVPVYFSSVPLALNADGSFVLSDVETVLDEIHFASPVLSASTVTNAKFGTAGVNNRTMVSFAQNFLLHSAALSTSLQETAQSITTTLLFDTANSTSTNGLYTQFQNTTVAFAIDSTTFSNIPTALSASVVSRANGIIFDTFKQTSVGAAIGYVSNSNLSTANGGPTYIDATNFIAASSLVGSNALSITCYSTTGNSIISLDTDIIIVNPTIGAYYGNTPSQPLEISNKAYVDNAMKAAINLADTMTPLAGTTSTAPITGSFYFDTTSNSDTSTTLLFTTLISTTIGSNNPITFTALGTSNNQRLRAFCPVDTDTTYIPTSADLTTRSYVNWYVAEQLAGLSSSTYVDTTNPQTISGTKTFSIAPAFTGTNCLTLAPAISGPATITCSGITNLGFVADSDFRLQYPSSITIAPPTGSGPDPDKYSLIPRHYVDTQVATLIQTMLGPSICATFEWGLQLRSFGISLDSATWNFVVNAGMETDPWESSASWWAGQYSFSTYFGFASDGSFVFHGIPDPSNPGDAVAYPPIGHTPVGAIFNINIADMRLSANGDALAGGTFRTGTIIAKKSIGDTTPTIIARNIHQDDTSGDSTNTLVGSSCSTTVFLSPGDQLYLLSEDAEYGSGSIVRIR